MWAGFAPNFENLIAARFFGGLCTAGGSVTLGIVADLFDVDNQQYAIAFIVLSSVAGTSVGPLVGGFIAGGVKSEKKYLTALYWIFWVQLIFGVVTQLVHMLVVPETRETILLDREAKRRRKAGETNIYGPNELEVNRFSPKKIMITWMRPFDMLLREPIVLCLSLLSGVRLDSRAGILTISSRMRSSSFSLSLSILCFLSGTLPLWKLVLHSSRLTWATLLVSSLSSPLFGTNAGSAGRLPMFLLPRFVSGGCYGRRRWSPLGCSGLGGLRWVLVIRIGLHR